MRKITDLAKTAQRVIFPTRTQELQRLQEEAGQTFTVEESKRRILLEERRYAPTELSLNAAAEELDLASIPLEEFLNTKRIDLFGVGSLRRVGSTIARELSSKVAQHFAGERVVLKGQLRELIRLDKFTPQEQHLIDRALDEFDTQTSNFDEAGKRLDDNDRIPISEFDFQLGRVAKAADLPALPKIEERTTSRAQPARKRRQSAPKASREAPTTDATRHDRLNRLKQRFVDTHRMTPATTRQRKSDRLLAQESPEVRKGFTIAIDKIKERRAIIKAVQSYYHLSDAQIARLRGRADIRLMDEVEYDDFLGRLDEAAAREEELTKLRAQVRGTIQFKEFKKVENLQQAMNLSPSLNKLDAAELRMLDDALQPFQTGDEFLSVRKLETVDNTDLAGIKTIREARERLAAELGVPIGKLDNIKVSERDRYRWDTSLAEKNPFYRLMVDGVNSAVMNAEARYLRAEEALESLIRAARKSRNTTIGQKLKSAIVPTDKRIFDYLEADMLKKSALAEDMTPEELRAADHIEQDLRSRRDYLIQHDVMKRYRSNYITHIRRGFLEGIAEDGLRAGLKDLLKTYELEESVFNILDQDTASVLPLEKFFQFAMRRTGQIVPSKNVARAYLSYVRTFEKKVALDSIVPKIDIYAHSLTPPNLTPRGLEVDRSLKRFINEWINTKKGRTAHLFAKQGGKIDLALRTAQTFTYLHDLALNIPVGIAAQFGEQTTTFINVGTKRYATGVRRLASNKGRAFVRKYRNFTGKTPWDSLHEASKGLPEKLHEGLFGLFRSASVRANKVHLLGSLTDEEWRTGEIATERLAALRREMGRYRAIEGADSIIGSTTEGSLWKQYKSWAIAPMRTVASNAEEIGRMLQARDPEVLRSREFQELLRATVMVSAVSLAAYSIAEEEDTSFIGKIRQKVLQDAYTIIGSLNPAVFTSMPRVMTFADDLRQAMTDLITLETNTSGELKGLRSINRVVVPVAARQFTPADRGSTKRSENLSPLPSLPPLPKLPKIPSLPSI